MRRRPVRRARGRRLRRAAPHRGALLHVGGDDIHLAEDPVSNLVHDDTAHLWDEVLGHHVRSSGAFLAAALVRAVGGSPWPTRTAARAAAVAWALAAGVSAGTNVLEGDTAALTAAGLACLVVPAAPGLARGGLPQSSAT